MSVERVRQMEQSMQQTLERTRDVRRRRQPIALHAPAGRKCRLPSLAVGLPATGHHDDDDDDDDDL